MKIQKTNNITNIPMKYASLTNIKGVNVSFSSLNNDEYYINARIQQHKNRQHIKNQRVVAFISAIGLAVTGAVGIVLDSFFSPSNKSKDIPVPETTLNAKPFDETVGENQEIITSGNAQEETTIWTTQPTESEIIEVVKTQEEILEEIPLVREQYNKIVNSLKTYSEHIGQDGLTLIQQKVDEIGDGKVDTIEVLKILFMESNGKMYSNLEDGTILKSGAGAYGAFQVTEGTADYLNNYYDLTGTDKELNVKDPIGNLEACIYNLKFLYDKRAKEISSGKSLPTGNDIKLAVIWSYHDGAWAKTVTDRGESYIQKYKTLSILDEYPEIVEYILQQ